MNLKNLFKAIGCVLLCQFAGIIGSVFTFSAIPTWYASLNKPFFSPPNWIFAPVWLALYTLMGISLYLILQNGFEKKEVKFAVSIFAIQLVLNAAWPILFFGLKNPLIAFAEILLLWLSIVVSIVLFSKISKKAAWLLVPYILWVSFAAMLNLFILQLNP